MAVFSSQTPSIGSNVSTQSSSILLPSPESGGWEQESVLWLMFSNCDHSARVLVCAVAPPWQRQMDWEPPYLPEEAVYGSLSGKSWRLLKFSFQVTAINLSRVTRIKEAPKPVCPGRRASWGQSSWQRLQGTQLGKVMPAVSRHANKWPVLSFQRFFWDFTLKKKKINKLKKTKTAFFHLQFSKIRVWFPFKVLQHYKKKDYCYLFLWRQQFVKH